MKQFIFVNAFLLLILTTNFYAQTGKTDVLENIRMRDPNILVDEKTKTYYIISSNYSLASVGYNSASIRLFSSKDLINWEGPHTIFQTLASFNQQQIAHRMPIRVIERLEVVQVHEQQRAIAATALARSHRLAQSVLEQATIGQFGKRVIERQLLHLVLHLFALGDVSNHANEGAPLVMGVRETPARQVTPEF